MAGMWPMNLQPNYGRADGMSGPALNAPEPEGFWGRMEAGAGRGPVQEYYDQRGLVNPHVMRMGQMFNNAALWGTNQPRSMSPAEAYQRAVAQNAELMERRRNNDPFFEFEEARRRGIIPPDTPYAEFLQISSNQAIGSNSPRTSARTMFFADGTILSLDNQGNRRVTDPSGNEVTGDEALAALQAGRQSGIVDQGARAEARIGGEGRGRRTNEVLNIGVEQAAQLPGLRRAEQLLQAVDTGGIDALRIAANNLFGVTSADEGELTNLLATAVLGQLRQVFGSQFTQQEGERLERIEAGIKKSPEANLRIIRQLVRKAEFQLELARMRAEEEGDTAILRYLDAYDNFSMDPAVAPTMSPRSPAPVPQASEDIPSVPDPQVAPTTAPLEVLKIRPGG